MIITTIVFPFGFWLLPKGEIKIGGKIEMSKEVEREFKVLREVISPENLLVMAELITIKQTKTLIGYMRLGKAYCFSHHIPAKVLEEIILGDIQEKAKYITFDEQSIREEFVRYNAKLTDSTIKSARKDLKLKQKRLDELTRLMQVAYEDRVKGKMPEEICISFIEKYSQEQKTVAEEITTLEEMITNVETTTQNIDDFIRNIKKYLEVPELTREMCYELIDRIVVGGLPKITGKERTIEIVYKVDILSVLQHKLKEQ